MQPTHLVEQSLIVTIVDDFQQLLSKIESYNLY